MPALVLQMAAGREITARPASASQDEAWAEAYDAARHRSVAWAAPEATLGIGHPLSPEKATAPPPADPLWASACVRAAQARTLVPPGREPAWIGQADTGWGRHFQLPHSRLYLADALDAFTGSGDAEDPLERVDLFDGHGTGTASVMISGDDDHLVPGDGIPDEVRGLCPTARLTPVRCANSVVLFSDLALARAIDHLAGLGVGVITISLGGLPSALLRDALLRAVHERGAIVVAAGGQRFPIVPYPAAYSDCIAVGASAPDDAPWRWTTGGRSIDVSAPGHQVSIADFGEGRAPTVRSGSGTSYATPHVAGAAALWLEYHGRARLLERYAGAQPLQAVFRAVLTRSARMPHPDWRTERHGAGILDIEGLLRAPLPPRAAARRPPRLTPTEHDLAVLADVLDVPLAVAATAVRASVHADPSEMRVAVTEVLRTVLSLPAESVAALRGAQGPPLARALAPALAPAASPHLVERLR